MACGSAFRCLRLYVYEIETHSEYKAHTASSELRQSVFSCGKRGENTQKFLNSEGLSPVRTIGLSSERPSDSAPPCGSVNIVLNDE